MDKNLYKQLWLRVLAVIFAMVGLSAWAVNPVDHTTVLNDAPKAVERTSPDDEEDPYFLLSGEADKALADKDFPTAVLRLREAIAIDPANPSNVLLLSNLGIAYASMDQDSLALDAYDRALDIAPSMTTILSNRAMLKLKMGNDIGAYRDFGSVIERDSLNASARYYHGLMSLYGGNLPDAEADFAVLRSIDPEGYNTNVALASLYSMTGRDKEAIPYYKSLIAVDPAPEYYASLAGCYLALENLSEASAIIAEGLAKCGDDPELYFYRAWLNRESHLNDAARADAQKAIALGADPIKVNRLLAK